MNFELIIISFSIKNITIDELCEMILIKNKSSKKRYRFLMIISKLRIINLIVIRSIIQSFNQVYYNSINESSENNTNRARYYLIIIKKNALTNLNVFFIK